MAGAVRPPILWDVYQEHLDEAAFVWGDWERALLAPHYTLNEVVAGPEQRLAGHLDGLVIGGRRVVEQILLPALEGDSLEMVRPSAWVLLQAEDADHFDAVLAALASAEPPKAAHLARALALSSHPAIPSRLAALWTHAEEPWRAVVLDVLAMHDLAFAAQALPHSITTADPALLATSLRLLRRVPSPHPGFLPYVEAAFAAADPAVRSEAMTTALVLGSRAVWDACRHDAAATAGPLPLALLALSPNPSDRAFVSDRLRDPATARHALWALGFSGDVEAADAAVAFLHDKALGPLAAETFSAITGLPIDGRFRALGVTRGPGEKEVEPDDSPPEVRPEDALPTPSPAAVSEWWSEHRAELRPGQRYVCGTPRDAEGIRGALLGAAMWRRPILAVEFALATRCPTPVEVRTWARVQRRSLAAVEIPAARRAASPGARVGLAHRLARQ